MKKTNKPGQKPGLPQYYPRIYEIGATVSTAKCGTLYVEWKILKAVDDLDWYVPDRAKHPGYGDLILVSCAALGDIDYTDPADAGLPVIRAVSKIDRLLHRWSEKKFYHA